MQRIAMSWLIYRLTADPFLVGLAGFIGQLPMLCLAPIAGVLIDRWDRRRVLIITQSAAMFQAALLGLLLAFHLENIYIVLLLSLLLGIVNTFDMPTRQSFVIEMVDDKRDLPNAIALNSFMVNIGKLVGPIMAGSLIHYFGESWCFGINAISYVGVILAFTFMKVKPRKPTQSQKHIMYEMGVGIGYVFSRVHIRSVIVLLALMSIVAMPYTDMMPFIATGVLHGGPQTLGWLRAAPGIGAIVGGLWMASRNTASRLGLAIPFATSIFGLGLIAFAYSTNLAVSVGFLAITGFGLMIHMSSSNTIIQSTVDNEMRGRTMSIYMMAMQGVMPIGSLLSGLIAKFLGVPGMYAVCGVCCVIFAAFFASGLPKWRENPATRHLAV